MPRARPPQLDMPSPDDIEQQFYEAMQQADLEKMMALWSDDDEIACVHPGGQRLIGMPAIRASFEAMFSSGAVDVTLEHVRRVQSHAVSVHSVVEKVRAMTGDGPQSAWVAATNVYVRTGLGWRLVVHHASPGSAREADAAIETGSVLH